LECKENPFAREWLNRLTRVPSKERSMVFVVMGGRVDWGSTRDRADRPKDVQPCSWCGIRKEGTLDKTMKVDLSHPRQLWGSNHRHGRTLLVNVHNSAITRLEQVHLNASADLRLIVRAPLYSDATSARQFASLRDDRRTFHFSKLACNE
jgi:hypothetical protein